MDQTQNLNQNVDTLFSNLENFIQGQGVIGKPVTYEDKTFMPVVSVMLGYGGGNTASKNQQGAAAPTQSPIPGMGNMTGGALGLGAKLSTDAVIVIDKGNMSIMQMNSAASAGQLMNKIPQIFSGMGQNKQQQDQQQQQGQQPNQQQ